MKVPEPIEVEQINNRGDLAIYLSGTDLGFHGELKLSPAEAKTLRKLLKKAMKE